MNEEYAKALKAAQEKYENMNSAQLYGEQDKLRERSDTLKMAGRKASEHSKMQNMAERTVLQRMMYERMNPAAVLGRIGGGNG